MASVDQSMMSSDNRAIRLKARADLIINESIFQGERCWIVKDPLAMKYFRLQGPEYLVLRLLDGTKSYRQIKTQLDRQFPEQRFRMEILQQLIDSFHKNGLLASPTPGQAVPLGRRRNKELRQKALGLLSSLVAIRFPGFDPDPILNWLYPKFRWFFTKLAFCLCLLICLAAAILVLTHFSEFMRKMPDFQKFFGINNLLFMALILIFTKTIHEFGHGLMCKHFGGECHEIGFMLLVMTPAMYCNTSDSWVLPNKWHRIAIGAGGMYVELVMAAICTFIWWNTNPGWLHYLCLNIMFLSSVSTVLFNANPLLRYDGYYILSDFLEIPNLAQKSKQALINWLRVHTLGMKPIASRMLPKRHKEIFAIYAVASFVYRWFVMIVIFWFLTKVFEPYGLEIVGHILIAVSLVGMIVIPVFKLVKFFLYPGRFREVKKKKAIISGIVLAGLVAAFCYVPFPHYAWAHFVIRPDGAQHVFVKHPGSLVEINCKPGEQVVAGQILAKLRNEEFSLELLRLESKKAELEADLKVYELELESSDLSARKIAESVAQIANIKQQIAIKLQQLEQLNLRADRDGTVISPPNVVQQTSVGGRLVKWDGISCEPRNLSAYLQPSAVPFCYVGDPKNMKAVLVIEQSDIKFLKPDQTVQLVLNQFRDTRIRGKIKSISSIELQHVPRELSKTNNGLVAVNPQKDGTEPPLITSYEASVSLSHLDFIDLRPGYYGQAKVKVGQASLGWRLWRYVRKVVNFK